MDQAGDVMQTSSTAFTPLLICVCRNIVVAIPTLSDDAGTTIVLLSFPFPEVAAACSESKRKGETGQCFRLFLRITRNVTCAMLS